VRLVAADGEQKGIVSLAEALRAAEEADLDLVEIVANAEPPVCKIMDFNKHLFDLKQKQKDAKKKQHQVQVKEIKLRPGTDVGDYNVKLRAILKFLEEGNKVKITLRFRGREMAHQQLGLAQLQKIEADVAESGVVEQAPKMEPGPPGTRAPCGTRTGTDGGDVYATERQQQILAAARRDGRVDVASLATTLDVTPETVRRDLTVLERHGLVRRVHGGAIPVEQLGFEPGLAQREGLLSGEKDRIAKAALEELPAGGAIILDAGTTTVRLAELLPTDRELTVVTHALPVATVLATRPGITLHLVGGTVRGRTLAAVGTWALRELADIHVDTAFLGTNGLSVEHGLTTPDLAEAAVKRALVTAARRTVVLADHTKLGRADFAQVAPLEQVDTLVTDSGVLPELADEVEAAGPRVVRA
jgi:DeoR family fructose operon transcriptional repressor